MCKAITKEKKVGKGYSLEMICSISGKPIYVTNKYGIFCEDMCELEENKRATKLLEKLLTPLNKFAALLMKVGEKNEISNTRKRSH